MPELRLGALCWNQYTDWPELLAAGSGRTQLGYDTLWTWDHLYPIVGSSDGPDLRGLADARGVGPGDGTDPDRADGRREHVPRAAAHGEDGDDPRPHLAAAGRSSASAAAWFEEEHVAFGLEFGDGFPERLRWLGEALPIMRGMLHGERPTATGPRYRRTDGPQRSAADPGAVAAADRGRRRAGDAQAGREVRRREQRRRRDREGPPEGGGPAPPLRDRRARSGRDRADEQPRGRRHPRFARGGPKGRAARSSSGTGSAAVGAPAGRDARGRRGSSRRTSRSATAISSRASRRRTTRNR